MAYDDDDSLDHIGNRWPLQEDEHPLEEEEPRKRITFVRWTISLLIAIPLLAIWILLLTGKLLNFEIVSASMSPTMEVGDRVLVWTGTPPSDLRNQIIALRPPVGDEGDLLTKRVIGVGGDTVRIQDGNVFLNFDTTPLPGEHVVGFNRKKWVVPANSLFVMGDNRDNSKDSRDYGPIEQASYVGRVLFRIWPLEKFGAVP